MEWEDEDGYPFANNFCEKTQGSSVLTRTQTVEWAMVKTLIDGELLEAK